MSVPYIGAKISVTSRSLIRYEGILAAVDPKEATISLEQVVMLGTEGRLPGHDIPPSDEIYEVVVFKSADIEDLQVFEAPASTSPTSRPFMDPAIVSSTRGSSGGVIGTSTSRVTESGFGWQGGATPIAGIATSGHKASSTANGAMPRLQFGTAVSAPVGTIGSNRPVAAPITTISSSGIGGVPSFGTLGNTVASPSTSGGSNNRPWEAAPRLNVNVEGVRPTFGSMAAAAAATAPITGSPSTFSTQSSTMGGRGQKQLVDIEPLEKRSITTASSVSKPNLITPSSLNKSIASNATTTSEDGDKVIAYNTITGRMEMVERQTRTFASIVSAGAGRFKVAGDGTARPTTRGDYDFAQANALLEKDKSLSMVSSNSEIKGTFYDKNNSFFDNISCEATCGKSTGPVDKNERKWNIETFGVPAPTGTTNYRYGSHHNYHHHHNHPNQLGSSNSSSGGYRRGGGARGGRGRGGSNTNNNSRYMTSNGRISVN